MLKILLLSIAIILLCSWNLKQFSNRPQQVQNLESIEELTIAAKKQITEIDAFIKSNMTGYMKTLADKQNGLNLVIMNRSQRTMSFRGIWFHSGKVVQTNSMFTIFPNQVIAIGVAANDDQYTFNGVSGGIAYDIEGYPNNQKAILVFSYPRRGEIKFDMDFYPETYVMDERAITTRWQNLENTGPIQKNGIQIQFTLIDKIPTIHYNLSK